MKIKVNDQVKITTGKSKGKSGKVIQVFPKVERVVVEGLNIMKKHLRRRATDKPGQIVELASPIHMSNAALLCPKCNATTRVGYKMDGEKKKRVCKKCDQFLD